MDDDSIPRDQFNQVAISDFEVNMDRDYIRGKIQNNGEHNITSSVFKFEIYAGNDSLDSSKLLLSQNFVVREPLKPGYSTEFYFELKMDYEFSNFLYTYNIVQIKGR
ncbi:MAG: hypothetical protein HQ506_11850 [Candidatus Marinimicrobia bacterium]|nr:hypothetical protein [Candidatus Neomarinimicrobiota bacterium]